jgi:glycerol kinase
MKLISDAFDSEYFATKVKDTNGVYVVPAFTGIPESACIASSTSRV